MTTEVSLTDVDALCDQLLDQCPVATTPEREFLGCQYDLGLAWTHFPEDSAASMPHLGYKSGCLRELRKLAARSAA